MENDSDSDGISDSLFIIKTYLQKYDQNSEFFKYFKNELQNVVIQLGLQDYFKDIIVIEPSGQPIPIEVSPQIIYESLKPSEYEDVF